MDMAMGKVMATGMAMAMDKVRPAVPNLPRAPAGTYPPCQRRYRVYCFAVRQVERRRGTPLL
jgi:hypothetical protein